MEKIIENYLKDQADYKLQLTELNVTLEIAEKDVETCRKALDESESKQDDLILAVMDAENNLMHVKYDLADLAVRGKNLDHHYATVIRPAMDLFEQNKENEQQLAEEAAYFEKYVRRMHQSSENHFDDNEKKDREKNDDQTGQEPLEYTFNITRENANKIKAKRWEIYERTPNLTQELPIKLPTPDAKDSRPNKIAITKPLRARFTYADDPGTPVSDTYILYWRYDDLDSEKLDPNVEYYQAKKIMLPIGIGKTDQLGFLSKSIPFDHDINGKAMYYTVDFEEKTFSTLPRCFKDGLDTAFTDEMMAAPETFSDRYKKANTIGNQPEFGNVFNAHKYFQNIYTSDRIMAELNQDSTLSEKELAALMVSDEKKDRERYLNYTRAFSNHLFDSEATYGFMVFPADRGVFKTPDVTTLPGLEAPVPDGEAPRFYAFKGRIPTGKEQDSPLPEPIRLHCTMAGWDHRLEKALKPLMIKLEAYQKACVPHMIMKDNVVKMRTIAELYRDYPFEPQPHINIINKYKLIDALHQLEAGIDLKTNNPSILDQNTGFARQMRGIMEDARTLWELMQSKAFKAEMDAYTKDLKTRIENDDHPFLTGPFMVREPQWVHIFITLGKAYAALSATPLAKEVFDNDVLPGFIKIVNNSDVLEIKPGGEALNNNDFKGDLNIVRRINDSFNDPIKSDGLPNDSLTSRIFEYASISKQIMELGARTPGPPSLLQILLDCYGNFHNKFILENKSRAIYHIRFTFAVFHYLNIFDGETRIRQLKIDRIFISFAGKGNLKSAKNILEEGIPFSDVTYDQWGGNGKNSASKLFKSVLCLLTYTVTIEKLIKLSEKEYSNLSTLDITQMVIESVQTFGEGTRCITSTILLLGKWERIGLERKFLKNVSDFTGHLTVTIGFLSSAAAYVECYRDYKNGYNGKAIEQFINGTGEMVFNLGYILRQKTGSKLAMSLAARLIGTAWVPVVGQVMFVAGYIHIGYLAIKHLVIPGYEKFVFPLFTTDLYEFMAASWKNIKDMDQYLGNAYTDKTKDAEPITIEAMKDIDTLYVSMIHSDYEFKPIDLNSKLIDLECNHLKDFIDAHKVGKREISTWDMIYEFLDSGVSWGYLNWRAIVPLLESGFEPKTVESLVKLPMEGDDFTVMRICQWYYAELKEHEPPDDQFISGKTYFDVISELASGIFTPSVSYPETKVLDHPHFRHLKSRHGILYQDYMEIKNKKILETSTS